MDLEDIKEIIELMKANDIARFELEKDGEKLKLQRGAEAPPPSPAAMPTPAPAEPEVAAPAPSSAREIVSPMVGTFYTAPSPDAPPFVTIGTEVTEETVVCIVEAMKVMNEVKADQAGVISQVVAENGKPVQFGQALFALK